MKLKEAYRKTLNSLEELYEINEARSMAKLIFEDLGINHMEIFTSSSVILAPEKLNKLNFIIQESGKKKPLQHILGYTWFYERKFRVSPACLIPRGETEQLVDMILKEKCNFEQILDIGTGSGCIAISLKLELQKSKMIAMDKSIQALEMAEQNALLHEADVRFIYDDIITPEFSKYPDHFDLIVSNPPYVRESEVALMEEKVYAFEPHEALFVKDSDPMVFYSAIREFCDQKLVTGGLVYLEINEALGSETASVFNHDGRYNTDIIKDIHGKERFIRSQRNE